MSLMMMYNSGYNDSGHVVHCGLRTYCVNQADPCLLVSNLVPHLVPVLQYLPLQQSILGQTVTPACYSTAEHQSGMSVPYSPSVHSSETPVVRGVITQPHLQSMSVQSSMSRLHVHMLQSIIMLGSGRFSTLVSSTVTIILILCQEW